MRPNVSVLANDKLASFSPVRVTEVAVGLNRAVVPDFNTVRDRDVVAQRYVLSDLGFF